MSRGPLPSPNARRRNYQPSEQLKGIAVQAPELANADEYGSDTLRWWNTWADSPQAESFLPSDWERLQMLAPLVESFWLDPKPGTLAEIRLNEERLGATVRDRQALRMVVKERQESPQERAARSEDSVVRLRRAFDS